MGSGGGMFWAENRHFEKKGSKNGDSAKKHPSRAVMGVALVGGTGNGETVPDADHGIGCFETTGTDAVRVKSDTPYFQGLSFLRPKETDGP
jgi:hypothetical protein